MLLFVSLFFFSMSYFYIHHTVYKDRPLTLEYNFRDFDIRPIFLLDKASNDDVYYSLFILFINHPLKSTSRFLWFIEPTIKVKWQTEIIAVHMFFFRPTGIMYTILLYSMYLDTMLWFFFNINYMQLYFDQSIISHKFDQYENMSGSIGSNNLTLIS